MNKFQNKYFSILSDSISTLGGYTEPEDAAFYDGTVKFDANVFVPEDTWWGQVISYLGGQLLVNNSFSGSTVTRHPKCMIESYGCSDERTSSLSRDGYFYNIFFSHFITSYFFTIAFTLYTKIFILSIFLAHFL